MILQCFLLTQLFPFASASDFNSHYSQKSENKNSKSSNYAFASVYTGENQYQFSGLQSIVVLGGILKEYSPEYARILLIPSNINISHELNNLLSSVWTNIVKKPIVKMKYNFTEEFNCSVFKLQAWNLTNYSKVLFISPNILPLTDFSIYFNYPAPSSVINNHMFSMNTFTSYFDSNFFLLTPNEKDLSILYQIAIQYDEKSDITPDTFAINDYFQETITILPFKTILGCDNSHSLILNDQVLKGLLNISAIYFNNKCTPWNSSDPISTLWKQIATYIKQKLVIPQEFRDNFTVNADTNHISALFDKSFEDDSFHEYIHNFQESSLVEEQKVMFSFSFRNIISSFLLAIFLCLFIYQYLKLIYRGSMHQIVQMFRNKGIYAVL